MTMRRAGLAVVVAVQAACSKPAQAPPPPPPPVVVTAPAVRETVTVRDPELERRLARVELQLWERDAQVDNLQQQLADARGEVVRAMAKLQTLATRAEAGSGMAEADVALQQASSGAPTPEVRQAAQLMTEAQAEFNKENYGGALYLANQAKTLASAGSRRAAATVTSGRQGEVAFALPIRLKTNGRANVREGPGTTFPVVFSAEPGAPLTGVSYLGEWVRVDDDGGRTGWVVRSLLAPR